MTEAGVRQGNTPLAAKELNLFQLTWPIFLELALFMLMGTADTLMLSGVSDGAVSAVGVANQFIFIAILVMEVVAHGASIVVSQYLGARRPLEAAKVSAIALTLNLIVGLIVSVAFLLFGDMLMRAANLHGDILAMAQSYLGIVGGWLFIQAIINTLSGIIRTHGFTRESMYVSLGMNVFHVLLNYMLIFGKFGFPEMGAAGAAVSTAVSRGLAMIVFFWLLYRVMEIRIQFKYYFSITKEYVRKILSIGIPTALESMTYNACQTVFLFYITFLGVQELAARQYAMNISQYIYLFGAALGMGTAIVVGRYIGAGKTEDAFHRVLKSVRWAIGITVLVDIVVVFFREPIAGVFTDDPIIAALTAQLILLSLLLESGRSFNLILVNALRATGDAKFTVYMGFISMVGMSLPLGYFLTFTLDFGLPGVWLAIAADEWLRGIVMRYRWKSRVWEGKALVSPTHTETETSAV